jgi:hypothetical protein
MPVSVLSFLMHIKFILPPYVCDIVAVRSIEFQWRILQTIAVFRRQWVS